MMCISLIFLIQYTGLEGTVTGLKPGKCYEFEIVAVNKEGESLPMKIADPVFTSENVRTSHFKLNSRHLPYLYELT